jgi:hypothetical protein
MALQQFTLRFGPHRHELNIPISAAADKTELAEALMLAGASLMGETELRAMQEEQIKDPQQKLFGWAD